MMNDLLSEISKCTICLPYLPNGVNPVLAASNNSKIVIVGQAPGSVVHKTGIPWDDQSGKRLREWLGIDQAVFYDPTKLALIPMSFCYPGKGKGGDLPPRKECAPRWHAQLFDPMREVQLTILIGAYAQEYYLGSSKKKTLTETVKNYKEYLPKYLPLPHPSPRNNIWLKKNSWFEKELIPELKEIVVNLDIR